LTRAIIVLLHGIRDRAEWQNDIRPILETIEGIECRRCQYGRFDLLRFLAPGPWRHRPAKQVARFLATVRDATIARPAVAHDVPISVIAHSFGTYTLFRALQHPDCPPVHDIILCGSVLSRDADFHTLKRAGMITGNIINDHSYRDVWPTVAESVTWGYSASGTYGFSSTGVENRAHAIPHGGFLKPHFARTYWKPLFETPARVEPSPLASRTGVKTPGWFNVFLVPWQWIMLAILLFLAARLTIFLLSDDGQRTLHYYRAGNDSGIAWSAGAGTDSGYRNGAEKQAEITQSAGGKPDLLIQTCPGGRERDRNAVLNTVRKLRAPGNWGEIKYGTYKPADGETPLKFNRLVSVDIVAPNDDFDPSDPSRLAPGGGQYFSKLRTSIAALDTTPSDSIRRSSHGEASRYYVIFCSKRFFGL